MPISEGGHSPKYHEAGGVRNVSLSFERLASFVAIRQTQEGDEVLRQLLLHCFVLLPDQKFRNVADFRELIDVAFGLTVSESRLQSAIDTVLGSGQVVRTQTGDLDLARDTRIKVRRRVDEAIALEFRVRAKWLAECSADLAAVDPEDAWDCLEEYLTTAFRQHSVQTLALIDPALDTPDQKHDGLRAILNGVLERRCPPEGAHSLGVCIERFLVGARIDADRATFIGTLADCTVSYYTLAVPPDIADKLRSKLRELMLFVDTNVLFGLVGLDDRPLVDVSHELIGVIRSQTLPFKLRYHERTQRELTQTFEAVATRLRGTFWPPSVSRGAAHSPKVSTIARLYHERNAERPITAESFFKPYEHLDVLVEEKGIRLYRDPASRQMQKVYDLMEDYRQFLQLRHREKRYEALEHDMTLIDCVDRLRSKAGSSLEAGALCLTTDWYLYAFDRYRLRQKNRLPATITPPQLLQLLRPFVPVTEDFDKSFAEAFAVPEFRTLGDRASVAAARLLEIVASYGNISETTVEGLLTNDLLLDGLAKAANDKEVRAHVESAIAAENVALAADRDRFRNELDEERGSRDAIVRAREEELLRSLAGESATSEAALTAMRREKDAALEALAAELAREGQLVTAHDRERAHREAEENRRIDAEARVARAEQDLAAVRQREKQREVAIINRKERRKKLLLAVAALIVSVVLIGAAELAIRRLSLTWVLEHPQSYGLRLGAYGLVLVVCLAAFRRDWSKKLMVVAAIPLIVALLSLLGGPRSSGSGSDSHASPPSARPAHR